MHTFMIIYLALSLLTTAYCLYQTGKQYETPSLFKAVEIIFV